MDWAALKSNSKADRPGASRGFTLIEVLVAMTIIAVALMASLRAAASLTDSALVLRDHTLAQWSAENQLALVRIQREFPDPGRRVIDCPQGDRALRCQIDFISTPNIGFRRVEIKVFDARPGGTNGHQLARLIGFATMPPR